MRLSFQEQNLICIYHSGSRIATIRQLREALPYMDAHDAETTEALLGRLKHMSNGAFSALAPEEVASR